MPYAVFGKSKNAVRSDVYASAKDALARARAFEGLGLVTYIEKDAERYSADEIERAIESASFGEK